MEAQPAYTITSMEPIMLSRGQGQYQPGYKVHFRTHGGQHSHVDVPRSETLDADVHKAVAEEAQRITRTMDRQGPIVTSNTG